MYGSRLLSRRWVFGSLVLSLVSGSILLQAAPPAWWSNGNPPVIDPQAVSNNHGVANIGQAKWMAKSALEALRAKRPDLAALVEADMVGAGKPIASWATPTNAEQQAQQRQPLLLGQLKAIAAPFYDRLQAADPTWLAAQASENGMPSTGSHYPWTATTADDANKAMATIGQLKAVFSLRFENLSVGIDSNGDEDGDGLTNAEEESLGTSPEDADTDGDGIPDGTDPQPLIPATVPIAAATTLLVWAPLE
jgi:hypothetical protein